jgi:hypothetical protein
MMMLGLSYGSDSDEEQEAAPATAAAVAVSAVRRSPAKPVPSSLGLAVYAAEDEDDGDGDGDGDSGGALRPHKRAAAPVVADAAKRLAPAGRDSPTMAALGLIRKPAHATAGAAAVSPAPAPAPLVVPAVPLVAVEEDVPFDAPTATRRDGGGGSGDDDAGGSRLITIVPAIAAVPLPPEPPAGAVDPAVQQEVVRYLAKGRSLVDNVHELRTFRNPTLYAKLVRQLGLVEAGTNYPRSLYDRAQLDPEASYEQLGEPCAHASHKNRERKGKREREKHTHTHPSTHTHTHTHPYM